MGRPINANFIGNITGSSQALEMTAWIPGDPRPCVAYAIGQRTTTGYNAGNSIGVSSGLVYLTNGGVALTQGTANVTVQAYGSSGSGATAVANLGVSTATANIVGSGTTANWYTPGDLLAVTGGTHTQVANVTVSAVQLGAVNIGVPAGPGYTVGDTFTWGYTGYSTPPVITVFSTTGNGNINGVTLTSGIVTNVQVTNTTPFSSTIQTNSWATGANFILRWDVEQLSVTNRGDYRVQPNNSVSFTGAAHGATGLTANLTWQLSSVDVLVPGHGYQAVTVNFSNSAAQAIGTVNAAGNVASVSVTVPGSGIAPGAAPAVSISTLAGTEYASKITNLLVETFQGNTYQWVNSATAVTASNQAQLQTA